MHEHSRRTFFAGLMAVAATAPTLVEAAANDSARGDMAKHERYMRLAIDIARHNPKRPFGSVIVDDRTRAVVGQGVVAMHINPTSHSEIVAMNDYVTRHGNGGWENLTMYGTGEACPMCISAMIWAGIPSVVYASAMPFVAKYVNLINLRVKDVIAAAHPLYTSKLLLGGVLASITDPMFANHAKAL